jgi:hypothetical protein
MSTKSTGPRKVRDRVSLLWFSLILSRVVQVHQTQVPGFESRNLCDRILRPVHSGLGSVWDASMTKLSDFLQRNWGTVTARAVAAHVRPPENGGRKWGMPSVEHLFVSEKGSSGRTDQLTLVACHVSVSEV